MTHPGVKFRGGDRWITPQPHEYVFRASGGFSGGAVDASTVRTQVGTPLSGGITITNFACPASVDDAGVLIVCVSATNNGGGATVNTVTWNGNSLVNLAEAVHSGNSSTSSVHGYLLAPGDLGATSDIVVDFDAVSVGNSVVCAYVVGGVAYAAPDVSDSAESTNSATVALPIVPTIPNDLILDWLTHVYSSATPDPAPSADNVEIAGAQVDDATSLMGTGSSLPAEDAASYDMNWGGMDSSSSSAVQVAVALKKFDGYPQPTTAKLVVGYDFSGIDSTVTVTGSGISNVTDSSGNGNAGTQATDGQRLIYGTATINGRLAADIGGINSKNLIYPDPITGWANNGQPPLHILLLVKVNVWTAGQHLFRFQNAGSSPRVNIRLSTSGGNCFDALVPTSVPGNALVTGSDKGLSTGLAYLVEISITGGTASLVVNEGSAATVASQASGEALTGRRLYFTTSSANASVGAVYMFNDALSAAELAEWRRFLRVRWAYA